VPSRSEPSMFEVLSSVPLSSGPSMSESSVKSTTILVFLLDGPEWFKSFMSWSVVSMTKLCEDRLGSIDCAVAGNMGGYSFRFRSERFFIGGRAVVPAVKDYSYGRMCGKITTKSFTRLFTDVSRVNIFT
jgi:hypothetical protein